MYLFFNWSLKITGFIPALFAFNFKTYYEDKKVQSRRIKGKAIVVSNHRSIWDFGLMIFLFWTRTLRCVISEILFTRNPFLTFFLRGMGGIKVDRNTHDFSFIGKCKKVLDNGGVVEIYPEARINPDRNVEMLEFKPSVVYLALESGAPIIPVYNTANYFHGKTKVIIGKPLNLHDYYDDSLSDKQNIANLTSILRERILELKNELERQCKEEKA